MKGYWLFLLLLICNVFRMQSQGLNQQINNYVKRNKIPHYTNRDSLKNPNKLGYFSTNSKGQTTLSLPKGAIDLSVPTGDSVVYGKIESPSFEGNATGVLIIAEYSEGTKVKENHIDMDDVDGSIGVRIDWCVDNNNEEQTSLFLYFLSGRIVSCPIKRNGDKLIQAFFMNEKQEIVKLEEEVRTCLLFEGTREGMVGRKLEQWNEELDEEMFMKKVSVGLKSYYAISYKLKKL